MSDNFNDENDEAEDPDFDAEESFEEDEDIEFDEEEGFDDFQTESSTLGDMWRNNPLIKIGTVLAGFAAIFVGIALFGGNGDIQPSITPPASQVSDPPGEEVSPAIEEAIREKNQQELEQAQQTGGTSIPIPVGSSKDPRNIEDRGDKGADPATQWRQIQAQRLAEQRERRDTREQATRRAGRQRQEQAQSQSQTLNQLSQAMQGQMQQLISEQTPDRIQQRQITNAQSYLEQLEREREEERQAAQQSQGGRQNGSQSAQQAAQLKTWIPAGKIEFGQLLLEANTDAPGPVLAQILSGPLKGSRLIGSFETRRNFLVLNFNTIVVNDQSISVEAIAINPATNNPGIVTEIDRRYFKRVILPGAAAFVEGFGEAVSESGRTDITVNAGSNTSVTEQDDLDTEEEIYAGVEEAAQEFGDILDEQADEIQPLLRIDAGTPIGILFTRPVIDPETLPEQNFNQQQGFSNQDTDQGFTGRGVQTTLPGQNAPQPQQEPFIPDEFINPELVNRSLDRSGIFERNQ